MSSPTSPTDHDDTRSLESTVSTTTGSTGPARRSVLKAGLGLGAVSALGGSALYPREGARAAVGAGLQAANPVTMTTTSKVHLAATDGWASMPDAATTRPPFWPDPLAPSPMNTYVFGFRDVTSLGSDAAAVNAERGKAQIAAPIMGFDEGTQIEITLSNLGLKIRPDLVDGHTIHWHGFVNAIPLFDGVPELSISVPIGREFTYLYRPHDAGTYMYHCHFEDVEHVQMGMTGVVYVRPLQNGTNPGGAVNASNHRLTYAYNDGDGSTQYDREFTFMLTELWTEAHYRDAHIQTTDWTDYAPSFWLLNGRAYPDTVKPNTDPLTDGSRLRYNPISSLITCRPGERVLLRVASLGYQQHSMTLDGVGARVVAKDASLLRGRDGTDLSFETNTIDVGPGESRDVIFTAPAVTEHTVFRFYDRRYSTLQNNGDAGYGGMLTEVHVWPDGTHPSGGRLLAQTAPNQDPTFG